MKKTVFMIILSALLVSCTFQNNLRADTEYPFYKHAVKLQVLSVDDSGAATASGFALDKEKILTAAHFCTTVQDGQESGALKDSVEIIFVNNNNELSTLVGGKIDKLDVAMDLCVVRAPKHGVVPLPLSKEEVEINDFVTVVGAPLSIFPVTSTGKVAVPITENHLTEDLNNRLIIVANGTFGSSGGPIYNEKREVIGVVMAKITDFLLIAVRVDTVHEFLEENYGK